MSTAQTTIHDSTKRNNPLGTAIESELRLAERRVAALQEALTISWHLPVSLRVSPSPRPDTLAGRALQVLRDAGTALHTNELAKILGAEPHLVYVSLHRLLGRFVHRVAPSTWALGQ